MIFIFSNLLFSQQFTIAVIPDTQNYTDFRYQTFSNPPFDFDFSDVYKRQVEYIFNKSQDTESPVIFAIHLGDNVLHQNKHDIEWQIADNIISLLDDKIPFAMIPGNHDYDVRERKGNKPDKYWSFYGSDTFVKYFGSESKHFKDKNWYIDSFNNGMSSAAIINYQDVRMLFIGLEMEAGDECLEWAQNVIDKNNDIPTIIATHEFLSVNNEKNSGKARRLTSAYRRDYDSNTPKNIWEKFIKKNNQIFLVLCGHSYDNNRGENSRIDLNEFGNPVYQILSDYEGRTELFNNMTEENAPKYGGDGWLRLLNFDLEKKQLHIQTYSTEFEIFETDEDSELFIDLKF